MSNEQWYDNSEFHNVLRAGVMFAAFRGVAHNDQGALGDAAFAGMVLESGIAGRNVYRNSGDASLGWLVGRRELGRQSVGWLGMGLGVGWWVFVGVALTFALALANPGLGFACMLVGLSGILLAKLGARPATGVYQVQATGIPNTKDLMAAGYVQFGTHPAAWVKPNPGESSVTAVNEARQACTQRGIAYDLPQGSHVQQQERGQNVLVLVVISLLVWIAGVALGAEGRAEQRRLDDSSMSMQLG